ncbi:RteC domain-containing protein [Flavobacterium sp. ASW18X]|uniref:RteC domain-containing protein n=1 Tax=Flavobacterium sp. ASW18X TaxID=2572595 RepID=UPI0010AE993E|nr:RteC domain-containing protein [Flavobacterium sp. ASW18X]TKD67329.1 hypothetical protein FBT53_00560 [Flavobacterium sp. ASW18X]
MNWSYFPNTEKAYNIYIEEIKNLQSNYAPFAIGQEAIEFETNSELIFQKHKNSILNNFEKDFQVFEDAAVLTTEWSSFKHFKDKYYTFLGVFFDEFPDAEEIHYIEKEYLFLKEEMPIEIFIRDSHTYKKLNYSNKKKIAFLENKALELGYEMIYQSQFNKLTLLKKPSPIDSNSNTENYSETEKIKWLGTNLELYELIKTLIEAKKLKGKNQKEVFITLFNLLGMEYSDIRKKEAMATIRQREKDKTPFVDLLRLSLEKWVNDRDNNKLM